MEAVWRFTPYGRDISPTGYLSCGSGKPVTWVDWTNSAVRSSNDRRPG
jgi:hypothetical protein